MASKSNDDNVISKVLKDPKLNLKKIDLDDTPPIAETEPEKLVKEDQQESDLDKNVDPDDFVEEEPTEVVKPKPEVKAADKKPLFNFQSILIVIVILFFLVSAGLYFNSKVFGDKKVVNNTNSSSVAGDKITLIKEFGEVFSKQSENPYTPLNDDEKELSSGSFVKVGNGSAHVLFPNNSLVSIDSNSEIQINYENGNTNINQLAGSTWNRVKKLTSNESYTVTSPTALATVRGTKFAVELSKKASDLSGFYTIEGKVNISQLGANKELLTNDEVVSPQFIEVKPFTVKDNPVNKGNLLPEVNQGRWFMRNRDIDKLFDAENNLNITNFIKNIRGSSNLQRILRENKSNTKKENCLELLDQNKIVKKDIGYIKITTPNDNTEFKTTSTIQFTTEGVNPCTNKAFDESQIKWYLDDKAVEFTSGSSAEQKNLPVGDYTVTAKVFISGNELTSSVKFKVVEANKSSSSSSSKSSSSSSSSIFSSSSSAANKPPTVVINNPKAGTFLATTLVSGSLYKYSFVLDVTATDPEDGTLTGSKVVWSANSTSPNSTGNGSNYAVSCYHNFVVTASAPPPTNCVITVTATDSKGLSASATVTIQVNK